MNILLLILIFIPSISFAQGFGLLYPKGTGATGLFGDISKGNLVASSQTISCGNILGEDGSFMLGEDGGKILQDCGGVSVHILGEDNSFMLGEDGTKILDESSGTSTLGTATPLSLTTLLSPSAWVTANSSNSSTVYLGNANVDEITNNVPLIAGERNVYLPTSDLSKVYVLGNQGDGVSFIYFGTSNVGFITDDSGHFIMDDSGHFIGL